MLSGVPSPFGSSTPKAPAAPAVLPDTVKRMEGMLWYELLAELDKTSGATDALGAGGGAFQSMFMWSLAQNDFGKYDSKLTDAAVKQLSAAQATGPHVSPTHAATPVAATVGAVNAITAGLTAADGVAPGGVSLAQAADFARGIWPAVKSAAARLGVPAVGVLAQTALETGWGAAAAGNNMFGIKAADGEASSVRATREMIDGVLTPQLASFRDYPSADASVADYVQKIQSVFTGVAGHSDVGGFANALQGSGYATASDYAAKIINVAQSPMMARVLQAIGGTGAAN